MTTSGTWNFFPDTGNLIKEAFDQAGIRPTEITREYMSSAVMSINLEMQSWSNSPVNLWEVSLVTFSLTQGVNVLTFAPNVMLVLDGYVTLTQGSNPPIDRIMVSISRDEFAAYPTKTFQAAQTVFWYNRGNPSTATLWPVPDGQSETSASFYVMTRPQDALLANGQTPDIPIRYIDALASRLAARLALKFNEKKYPLLKPIADAAFALASVEDQERVQLRITPDFSVWSV